MQNIIFLMFLISLCSCRQETEVIDPDLLQIHNCSKIGNQTPGTLSPRLIGKWNWNKRICLNNMVPDLYGNTGLTVEFQSDSTFTVYENNDLLKSGTWKIATGLNSIEIDTEPFIGELLGDFSMCDDKFVCNNIGLDKCANFFERN